MIFIEQTENDNNGDLCKIYVGLTIASALMTNNLLCIVFVIGVQSV